MELSDFTLTTDWPIVQFEDLSDAFMSSTFAVDRNLPFVRTSTGAFFVGGLSACSLPKALKRLLRHHAIVPLLSNASGKPEVFLPVNFMLDRGMFCKAHSYIVPLVLKPFGYEKG